MKSRYYFASVAVIAVLAAALAIAGGGRGWFVNNSSTAQLLPISIGTIPYEKNALIYIAEERNLFAAHGLKVTLKDYDTGVAAAEAMAAGELDIAVASDFVVVGRALKDYQFRILASIAKTQDDYVLGRSDRGVTKVSDLKGKRVGVKKQTAAEFYLGRFLDRHGMSIREVELVDIAPGKSVQTFAEGDLDAIVIWQPYSYQIKKQLADKVVSWSAQNGQLMYWNMLARDSWIAEHGAVISGMLQALSEAERYLNQHPVEARAIVQRRLNYDEACISAIWPDSQFTVSLDQSLLVALEDETRWMIANGLTGKKTVPDYFNHIYLVGLTKVRPEAVNLVR